MLDMLKWVSLSPNAVMRSERALLDTALRELAVDGCNTSIHQDYILYVQAVQMIQGYKL